MRIRDDQKISDEELVDRIARDDERAFDLLFYRYVDYLHNVAFNRLKSREVADDLVQEVFAEYWERRHYTTIRDSVKGYLYQSVKYQVFRHIRHATVREKQDYINRIRDEYYQESPDTDEELEVAQLQDLIDFHFSRLPEKTRNIYNLSRRENFSHDEIAEKLHCSPKTVEYHISKVLKHLRFNLRGYLTFLISAVISLWAWVQNF